MIISKVNEATSEQVDKFTSKQVACPRIKTNSINSSFSLVWFYNQHPLGLTHYLLPSPLGEGVGVRPIGGEAFSFIN